MITVEQAGEKCKRSLYVTSRKLLNYQDVNRRTHGRLIEILQSPSKRKLVVMPRGSLKSSVASVAYPIWILFRNPNARILIDSELYTNSKNFLREIKQHMQSPLMSYLFGSFIGDIWNESEIVIKQRTKILKEPSIMCGGVGTTKVGQHVDYIIADDLNSENNTNTHENALKVIDHYRRNISILEPTGTYCVIGTRYSELDVIGHILQNEINLGQGQS